MLYKFMNICRAFHFKLFLVKNASYLQVRLKCCQLFSTLISHIKAEDAMPYIHVMAPKLIDYLYTCSSNRPSNELDKDLLLASINTFEMLIGIAEESKSK